MTQRSSRIALLFAGFLAMATSLPVLADTAGFLSGRSMDPAANSALSVDIGFQDFIDIDFLGVRANFRYNETITAFVNIANADAGFPDGFSFGGGAFIHLPNQRFSDAVHVAIKPSINFLNLERNGFEADFIFFGGELALSGKQNIADTPLKWFANAGLIYTRIDSDFDSDDNEFDLIFGGGAYMTLGPGDLFFGAEIADGEFSPGVGYRFSL